ncbi:hypothetical protein [Nostoc sp. 106C]|uniref:hypothetical protein n=1 Tax=Nostoc sp. 106C TaxID=1932667 RepID=UPI000A36D345|nr:hypothetical protein [Nostoc sp. 106C]OUL33890.1 hypothetical protein BV375_05755 [Nostoc sp. 106C]
MQVKPAINILVLAVAIQRLQPHTVVEFLPKFDFQVSQSREKPTTKHESMIFSPMVLQIEVVVQ